MRVRDVSKKNKLSQGKPLISVIVPNYRHAEYLARRIKTIVEQTHENIEIILLDDASPDNSKEILTKFATACEKVVALDINKVNSGKPITQWLRGVSLAKGDYIWIAESDDEAKPNFLSELLSLLSKHPSAGMAYCDSEVIDEHSRYITNYDYSSPHYKASRLWKSDFCMHGADFVVKYMAFRNLIPNVSAVLFRTHVLRESLCESPLKYCADWETYNKILLSNDIAYSHKAMNKFRKHIQTTRWHDKKSYAVELKEKISLLKTLKQALPLNVRGQTNIDASLACIFANRHKHRRLKSLCEHVSSIDITQITEVYIFGANDIAERVIETLLAMGTTPVVLDTYKAGQNFKGIEVSDLVKHRLSATGIVIICSLRHQDTIQKQLQDLGFKGRLLKI
jgi:glycosyltransferase involved in cell wall biosynthesis